MRAPPGRLASAHRAPLPDHPCRRSHPGAGMNILIGVLALVGGYFILSLLRAILFPPKAQPLEYKPRQVGSLPGPPGRAG